MTQIKDVDSLMRVKILMMIHSLCDSLTHSKLCNMLSVTMEILCTILRVLIGGFQHPEMNIIPIALFPGKPL